MPAKQIQEASEIALVWGVLKAVMGESEFRQWGRTAFLEDLPHDLQASRDKLFELTGTRDPKKVDLSAFGKNSK